MKCPSCGVNHKKKAGQDCVCGYTFVFNPAFDDGMTDGRFLAIARKASANDTYFYTLPQLYAAYCKRQRITKVKFAAMLVIGALLVAGGIVSLVGMRLFFGISPGTLFGGVMGIVGMVLIIAGIVSYTKPPPPFSRFDAMVQRWLQGKSLPKLILTPSLHQPPPEWQEHDIYDYGVERILVVERDILVDWFVLNGFHAQERTLVIAESGYPTYLAPVADRMLRENPNLPIYLLHDAGASGQEMAARIAHKPLLARHTAVDLGLFPEDVKALRRMNFMHLSRDDYAMPVDYLPYAAIAPAVGAAMTSNMTFAQLIAANQAPDSASDSGPSSFG